MTIQIQNILRIRTRLLRAVALIPALFISSALFALPAVWDGGAGADHSWQNALNWNPDGVPISTTDVTLGSGITSGLVIESGSGATQANSILINTLNPFTLHSAGFSMTLTSGNLTRQDLAGTEANQTLDLFMAMANNGTWNIGGSGTMTVGGLFNSPGNVARSFTKTGGGFLEIQNPGYTGTTTLSGGVLRLDNNSGTSAISMANGTQLQLASFGGFAAPLTIGGGATALRNISGTSTIGQIIFNVGAEIDVDSGTLTTFGGVTDGPLSLGWTKGGAGTMVLQGPGTYDGGTFIANGILRTAAAGALGTGIVFVAPNGTLDAGPTVFNNINLGGTLASSTSGQVSGPITLTNNVTINAPGSAFLTVNGSMDDGGSAFGMTKTGTGTAILGGTNNFSGPITVAAGTLRLASNVPSGVATTVQSGGTLEITDGLLVNRPLQISGPGAGGFGALLGSGVNTWPGAITLGADSSVGTTSELTVTGPITGNFGLTKVGVGRLILTSPANSFSSMTIASGSLRLTSPSPLPANIPIIVTSGGNLELSGNAVYDHPLNLSGAGGGFFSGAIANASGENTFTRPVTLAADSFVIVDTGRLTFTDDLSSTALTHLNKTGPGELVLGGNSTNVALFIEEGILTAQSNGALMPNSFCSVTDGATLQLTNNITTIGSAPLHLHGHGSAGQGGLFNGQGNNNFAGGVFFDTDTTIGAAAGSTLTISGGLFAPPVDPPFPLVKVGPGTLVLITPNSYFGGTFVNAGTLSINSDQTLGDPVGQVTLNNGGKLFIAADTTSARTFNLNSGTIQVNSGVTMSYNGATITGGFLRGPGTHAITGVSNFSGVTALAGTNITQSASTTLNNFTNSGSFTNNAPLTWDGGYNTGAARLTVNSTLNTSGFENDGQIIINNAATLTNSGNTLASTGGSRITINTGGTLDVSGNSLDLNGALLVNNGTITGTTNVNFLSLAKGSGLYGSVNITDGGKFSPGNSPGSVTTGSSSWSAGGNYVVELANAIGIAGADWDIWNIDGSLNLNATLTTNRRFTISLASLSGNSPDSASNFDPTRDYSWVILHANGGITGLDPAELALDTSGFKNALGGGHLSIGATATDLMINFSAVPESAALTLLATTCLLAAHRRSRRINCDLAKCTRHGLRLRAAVALVCLASSSVVLAEPRSWDGGGGNGAWNTASNWNPDGVPTSSTDVTLGSGVTPGLVISVSLTQAAANTFTIATTNAFSIGPGNFPSFSLTTGNLVRQDLAGIESDQAVDSVRMLNDGLWNINGQGTLTVRSLDSAVTKNFTKTGNGLLNLQFAGYRGTTTVNQGILRIGFMDNSGAISIGAAAELQLSATNTDTPVTLLGTLFNGGATLRNIGGNSRVGQVTLGVINLINVDAGNLTIAGGITDGAATRSWGKNGPGTVVLRGPGTYQGTTFINDGTLNAQINDAIGTANAIINPVAALGIGDGINVANALELGGTLAVTSGAAIASGPVTLTANATLSTPNAADSLSVTGTIADNGAGFGLTKIGPGTAILAGTNTATGSLTVAAGMLSTAVVMPAGAPTTVAAGATLDLQNDLTINRPLQISGAGAGGVGALSSSSGVNNWSGAITLEANAAVGALSDSLTLSGPVTGAFGLSMVGNGTKRLTNPSNNFSSLNIIGGILSVDSQGPLPASAPITVSPGGSLSVSGTASFNRTLNLNGAGSSPAIGALDNEFENNTWSGPITLQSSSTTTVRADRLTISGNISGAFTLTKSGPGELALTGANNYGDTFINEGVLTVTSIGALPSNHTATVASGATLQLQGGLSTPASVAFRLNGQGSSGQGALFSAQGSNTVGGTLVLASDSAIGAAAEATLILSGLIFDDAIPLSLVKVGQGTLVLAGTRTNRGGTFVSAGTLSIDSDARLGPSSGQVTLTGGKLLITASTATGRVYNLNNGSIQPNTGVTFTYNGATISGGFLRGPGTHAIGANSTFSGVTALAGTNITQSASTTLNNFTNAGNFASSAPLIWDGGFNTAAGSLTISNTTNVSGFENTGAITINNGGALNNSGNTLTSGGGGRITINPGGQLNLGATSLDLNGSLLINNGAITGATNVNFGALAKGSGVYGPVNVTDGGKFSPGNSPGSVTTGSTTWNSGGSYIVEISDALASPGIGWDSWNINGLLNLNATPTTNGRFTISLSSLDTLASNFDPAHDYTWPILHASDGITGFDLAALSLDSSGFKNPLASGHFYLESTSSDLLVHFSSVPEPTAIAFFAVLAALAAKRHRRPCQINTTAQLERMC